MITLGNTRKWSTPAIIGTGVFVAVSGVLMFFGIHNPIGLAHEWLGLVFAAAIFLHIANHWRSFKNYFSMRTALAIVGAAVATGAILMALSATQVGGGNPMMKVVRSFENAPLNQVSLLLERSPESIVQQFTVAGLSVEGADSSIMEIASANDKEPKSLVAMLFEK